MNIGLIAMSGVRVRTKELDELGVTLPGFVRRGKLIASLPSLGLLTVAGMTPARHALRYLDIDRIPPLDSLPDFDLVGISSLTARIDEAYLVAEHYRRRGARVVMGGLHVSALPGEALEHCDAVVTGGAEDAWPRLLADAERGELKSTYRGASDNLFENGRCVLPRFELLQGRPYNRVTVQTSRGCPRACEFCGASLTIAKRYNQKPVERVVAEIREARRSIREPFFEFADDNTFLDKDWSKRFLRALIPEGIRYFTETDASVADDEELCDLLAQSGCAQLLIGFESPREDDLRGIDPGGWKHRQAPRILRAIDRLQSRGVSVNGCFILGLDNHTPDIFEQLHGFASRSGLADVQYTVLTPFPGTPLYARLKKEGRLLRERFWERCTLFDVNFIPARMSVEELERGMRWLFERTYTQKETSSRLRKFAVQRRKREQR